MLCLGPKKSLTSPRLKLTAQGVAYQSSKFECEDHSSIQVPQTFTQFTCVQNWQYQLVMFRGFTVSQTSQREISVRHLD